MSEQGDLLGAVQQLSRVVKALDETVQKEYPKRFEVERDFITKIDAKKRWGYAAIIAVTATIASFFVTVSSVNYCFLNGVPEKGERDVCKVFPGWEESFDNNRVFMQDYMRLQEEIAENRRRLDKIEGK